MRYAIALLLVSSFACANEFDFDIGQRDQLTKGLVAYWSMRRSGATLYDETGRFNAEMTSIDAGNGTSYGVVGPGTWYTSNIYSFTSSRTWGLTDGYTLTAWINMPTNAYKTKAIIGSDRASAGTSLFQYRVDNSNTVRLVSFSSDGTVIASVVGNTVLSTGVWYFVSGVYDPAIGTTLYVNGDVDKSSLVNGTHNNTAGSMYIAARNNEAGNEDTFEGYLDEVRFYNMVLTSYQIKQLYRMGATIYQNR